MKELSIKEKAKRYDEAIKVAKGNYETIMQMDNDCTFAKEGIVNTFHHIFPELKDSEDERIRKALKQYFINSFQNNGVAAICGVHIKDVLAWLEKQGGHAKFINGIQVGDKVTRNEDGVLVNLSQLNRVAKKDKKQGKNNMGISEATKQKLEDNLHKALEKETPESWNEFLDEQGEQKPADKVEAKFKAGDIIRLKNGDGLEWTVEEALNNGYYTIVCADRDDFIQLDDNWELVEQKSSWSEEDEKIANNFISQLGNLCTRKLIKEKTKDKYVKWLKSLKDKVQPKQEWSEQEQVRINRIVACLENLNVADNDILLKDVDWLKSLRPQNTWKPSDEQFKVLNEVLNFSANHESPHWNDYIFGTLNNLIRQLKKLREE